MVVHTELLKVMNPIVVWSSQWFYVRQVWNLLWWCITGTQRVLGKGEEFRVMYTEMIKVITGFFACVLSLHVAGLCNWMTGSILDVMPRKLAGSSWSEIVMTYFLNKFGTNLAIFFLWCKLKCYCRSCCCCFCCFFLISFFLFFLSSSDFSSSSSSVHVLLLLCFDLIWTARLTGS